MRTLHPRRPVSGFPRAPLPHGRPRTACSVLCLRARLQAPGCPGQARTWGLVTAPRGPPPPCPPVLALPARTGWCQGFPLGRRGHRDPRSHRRALLGRRPLAGRAERRGERRLRAGRLLEGERALWAATF